MRIIALIVSCSIHFALFSQRSNIAVHTSKHSNNVSKESIREIDAFFNSIARELGYVVVERESIKELFEEYLDQRKEDYLDGITTDIKLVGAKYYLFIDPVEVDSDKNILIYYSLVDIFQGTILFCESFSVSQSHLSSSLDRHKEEISKYFDTHDPMKLHFYSWDGKKGVKLINKNRIQLEKGKTIYGFSREGQLACELSLVGSPSSNMLELKITSQDKKVVKILDETVLGDLVYSSNRIFSKRSNGNLQTSIEIDIKCLSPSPFLKLQKEMLLNPDLEVLDSFHEDILEFERKLQKNELFMEGKSFFQEKEGHEKEFELKCGSVSEIKIFLNDKFLNQLSKLDASSILKIVNKNG